MSRTNGMRWVNPEDELVATCARIGFGEAERARIVELCRLNSISWNRVYSTARLHSVAPLVYRNLGRIDPGDLGMRNGALNRFRRRFGENLVVKRQYREDLWSVLSFFNGHALDVMLIKGAGVDLFGDGSGRYAESRDVDLIVRAREGEISKRLLAQMRGLAREFPIEFDFYGHHDIDLNGALPIDWDQVWADAVPVRYGGHSFYIMSPEDALVAACINACRKRYFNLKTLCAIDGRLRHMEALDWDLLAEKARAYRVTGIVYAALTITARVMSIQLPPEAMRLLRPSRLRKFVMDLLSRNMSFATLASMYSGAKLANRHVGMSLLLPYASYRGDQIVRKLRFTVWGER